MASKKQIAWRKKFARMSKAGKFRKKTSKSAKPKKSKFKSKADFDKRIEKYEQSEFVPLDLEALRTEDVFEEYLKQKIKGNLFGPFSKPKQNYNFGEFLYFSARDSRKLKN